MDDLYSATTELVATLTVAPDVGTEDAKVVYSFPVTLGADDIAIFMAQYQIVNGNPWNVGIVRYITLGTSATDTVGLYFNPLAGDDTISTQQGNQAKNVWFMVSGVTPGTYHANFVMYCQSTASNGTQTVGVYNGFGGIKGLVFRR
jgi:hypothetical protein